MYCMSFAWNDEAGVPTGCGKTTASRGANMSTNRRQKQRSVVLACIYIYLPQHPSCQRLINVLTAMAPVVTGLCVLRDVRPVTPKLP